MSSKDLGHVGPFGEQSIGLSELFARSARWLAPAFHKSHRLTHRRLVNLMAGGLVFQGSRQ